MLDIASFGDIPVAAVALGGLALPIVYVAAFNSGPVGKNAREVLEIPFRRQPPK